MCWSCCEEVEAISERSLCDSCGKGTPLATKGATEEKRRKRTSSAMVRRLEEKGSEMERRGRLLARAEVGLVEGRRLRGEVEEAFCRLGRRSAQTKKGRERNAPGKQTSEVFHHRDSIRQWTSRSGCL